MWCGYGSYSITVPYSSPCTNSFLPLHFKFEMPKLSRSNDRSPLNLSWPETPYELQWIASWVPPAFLNAPGGNQRNITKKKKKKKQDAWVISGMLASHIECQGFSFKNFTLSEYSFNTNKIIYREQNIVIKGYVMGSFMMFSVLRLYGIMW